MADTFKVGQVVQLKSGGPKMTVSGFSNIDESVYCTWFAGAKKEHGSFPPDTLMPALDEAKAKPK